MTTDPGRSPASATVRPEARVQRQLVAARSRAHLQLLDAACEAALLSGRLGVLVDGDQVILSERVPYGHIYDITHIDDTQDVAGWRAQFFDASGEMWVAGQGIVQPMAVHITSDELGGFTVSHEATGVYGCGIDPPTAIEDFRAAVTDTIDTLESAENLSTDLAEILRLLRWHRYG
jgi:hypothetical protein